jgi:hypothetical protein
MKWKPNLKWEHKILKRRKEIKLIPQFLPAAYQPDFACCLLTRRQNDNQLDGETNSTVFQQAA